jgi:hypothetical protein
MGKTFKHGGKTMIKQEFDGGSWEGLELDKWKDGIKYDVVSKCFVHDLVHRPTEEELELRKRAEEHTKTLD